MTVGDGETGCEQAGVLVTGDGTRLWFERRQGRSPAGAASRPLMVLCGPGGRNAACWPSPWLEARQAEGFDVLRFDWRGQGRSDWSGPPAAVEAFVDDVEELCRAATSHEPAGPLVLVGVGLGGRVALDVARRRADRAEPAAALVLAATSAWYADPSLPGPSEPVVVGLVLRRRGGGAAELLRSLAREAAVECGGDQPLDASVLVPEVERWLDHGFNPEDSHRLVWLAAPCRWDDLEGLADRVVVVHGASDPVVPMAHAHRLAERSAGRLVVVPDAGHHLGARLLDALASAIAGQ